MARLNAPHPRRSSWPVPAVAFSAALVAELKVWICEQRVMLSRGDDIAKAMDMLKHWPSFARFLNDGRIRLSNDTAERALRGIALWCMFKRMPEG